MVENSIPNWEIVGWAKISNKYAPSPENIPILVKFADGSMATAKCKTRCGYKEWHLCGCFDPDNGRETHDGCCQDPVEWLTGFYPEIDKNNSSSLVVEYL